MKNHIQVYNDELTHHGVKGMRWGVKKMATPYIQSISKAKKMATPYIQKKKEEKEANKKLEKKLTGVNITRSALSVVGNQIIKKNTDLSPGKAKVAGMIAGELGSLAVGKALKVSNKDLAINSTVNATVQGTRLGVGKLLKDKTNVPGYYQTPIALATGNLAGGAVKKILNR